MTMCWRPLNFVFKANPSPNLISQMEARGELSLCSSITMMMHCNVASKVVIMVRLIEDDKKTSVKGRNIIFELELVKVITQGFLFCLYKCIQPCGRAYVSPNLHDVIKEM